MVIREWRGRALASRSDAYPDFFRSHVLPDLQAVPGFLGADLCQRHLVERIEFTVLTRWSSMDAVRGFAGEDVSRAVVEPGAASALVEFDEHVSHHEVLVRVDADDAKKSVERSDRRGVR